MKVKLQKKEAQEQVLTAEWAERWQEIKKILQEQKTLKLQQVQSGVMLDSDRPHLLSVHDDLLSTGVTLYHLNVRKNNNTLHFT